MGDPRSATRCEEFICRWGAGKVGLALARDIRQTKPAASGQRNHLVGHLVAGADESLARIAAQMMAISLRGPSAALTALLLASSSLLAAVLLHWSADGPSSLVRFLLAFVLLVYLPGSRIAACLGLAADSLLERAMLSIALGIPVSSFVYWLCGYAHAWRLFWVWPLLALGLSRPWRLGTGLRRWGSLRVRYAHVLLLIVFLCTAVPFCLIPPGFRDLARTADGGLTFYALADTTLHVSIANELTHTVPPQNPFLPGRPLNYHYGMDLLAAMLASSGASTMDLTVRYVPLVFMSLVVSASFCCARRWLASETAAALVAFLVVLGEDLSFVPGLLLHSGQIWAVYFFGMPTSVSLYSVNPMLAGLGFLVAGLFCLERFFTSERAGWLIGAALLAASLVEYKVFAAALLLLGLGATAAVYGIRFRRWTPLYAFSGVAMAASPFLLATWFTNSGRIVTRLEPWLYVSTAFVRMGFGETSFMRLTRDFYEGRFSVSSILVFCGLALPLYLLLTFGARAAGLGDWARALVKPRPEAAFSFLLAALVLIGAPLSLLFAVSPAGYPARWYYNNAVWFLVLSKYLLWPFSVGAVWRWARGGHARIVGAVGLIAFALPSTIQFIAQSAADQATVLDAPTMSMLEFVRKDARPGAVCWAQETVAEWVLSTTRCRALALDIFAPSFLSPLEQDDLRGRRELFWAKWEGPGTANGTRRALLNTLSELSVDYVVAKVPTRRSATPTLEIVFHNEAFTVYRVRRAAENRGSLGNGGGLVSLVGRNLLLERAGLTPSSRK
jgi:hypothetical protein